MALTGEEYIAQVIASMRANIEQQPTPEARAIAAQQAAVAWERAMPELARLRRMAFRELRNTMTAVEIAGKFGMTRQRVHQIMSD